MSNVNIMSGESATPSVTDAEMMQPITRCRKSVPLTTPNTKPASPRFEVDAKNRPFKAEVVRQAGLDPENITYAVASCRLMNPILKHGAKVFTNWEYEIGRTDNPNWAESDSESDCESSSDSDDDDSDEDKAGKKPLTELRLPLGMHCGEHKGQKLWLLIQEIGNPVGCSRSVEVKTQYIFFAEGRGKIDFIKDFVESLVPKDTRRAKKRHFQYYRWSHCQGYWQRKSEERARPMESVVLPNGIKESVAADMERFLGEQTKKWYKAKGIPYKRCYMFYGTPGTGKTSLITALAGRFRRKVCFLSAHHPRFTDEALKNAMEELPYKSFVVLEDIDSLFDKNRKSNNNSNPLTFTGLLNVLDGIGEQCGTIFIMTTNFIDRLDDALIRAGRVDMKVEFKKADDNQLQWMFKWFYDHVPEEAESMAPLFVEEVRKQFPDGTTMAELQQHFVDNMHNDAATCVATVKDYNLPLIQKRMLEAQRAEEAKKLKEDQEREAKEKKKEREGRSKSPERRRSESPKPAPTGGN